MPLETTRSPKESWTLHYGAKIRREGRGVGLGWVMDPLFWG
jgi:hypothetical protein